MNKNNVAQTTNRIIQKLHERQGNDKAVLAALRHSNSVLSKQATVIWPLMFTYINSKGLSKNGDPTYAENAIFVALRCYAIFEQGNDDIRNIKYSDEGAPTLFKNLSALRKDEQIKTALDRRIQVLLSTTNFNSAVRSITSLTKILKANHPKAVINYPDLAEDLYWFQNSFEDARKRSLKWGREYFGLNEKVNIKEKDEKEND